MYYEIERFTRVKEQMKIRRNVDIEEMIKDGYKNHFNLLADVIYNVMNRMDKEGK